MSKIQRLIKQYPQTKNEIIREIQKQDSVWIAYSPATKNFYADFHRGAPTAFLFSEEKFCNAFKRYLETKNVNIETMENLAQNRIPLLSDLIRSGIEQVIVDNGQTFVIFEINDLIKTPDFSSLPKEERPVSNPSLIMHTNMYFQGISTGNTEKNVEYNMMKDIYEATFLMPISVDGRCPENCVLQGFDTGTAVFDVPRIKLGASRTCIPLFTDWIELSKLDKEKICIGNTVDFNDILRICETGELVALNPLGFNLIMDKTTALSIRSRFETEPYVPTPVQSTEPVQQAPVQRTRSASSRSAGTHSAGTHSAGTHSAGTRSAGTCSARTRSASSCSAGSCSASSRSAGSCSAAKTTDRRYSILRASLST